MTSSVLFKNTLILRRSRTANFPDLTQKKLKKLQVCTKMQYISVFLDIIKVADYQ